MEYIIWVMLKVGRDRVVCSHSRDETVGQAKEKYLL